MRSYHVIIPLDIIQFVLQKRIEKSAGLYVHIQIRYQKCFRWNSGFISTVKAQLGIKDTKTVKKYLNVLVGLNWLGYNDNTRIYYTRSIDFIHWKVGFHKRQSIKVEVKHLKNFRAFLAGAFISSLVRGGIRKAWAMKKRTLLQANRSNLGYWSISNWSIAKILMVSEATASRLKKMAREKNYIVIKPQYQYEDICVGLLSKFKKVNELEAHRVRVRNGKIAIQMPDLCKPNLILIRRRKK